MVKHGEEAPGDSDAAGKVTLGGRECVGGRGGLEEEQGQEDEDLGEDTSAVTLSVHAKRVKGSKEAQECGESVPQGEGEMDPKLVVDVLGRVILLDNVEDVRNSCGDEERQDPGDDIVSVSPNIDVEDVEEYEERESPVDAVDDGLLARVEELIDDSAKEEKVDDGPEAEHPGRGRQVRLFARSVDVAGSSDRIDVRSEEQRVEHDVDDLEQDAISPVSH